MAGSQWHGEGFRFLGPRDLAQDVHGEVESERRERRCRAGIVGDKLYVFTRQGSDEVTRCLDAATGKELWKDSNPAPAVTGADRMHPGPRSTPAVGDGMVVTLGVGGTVSCLNAADGKVVWRKDNIKAVPQFHTASSPLLVDGMVIVQLGGRTGGAVVAYDLKTGDQKWKAEGDGAAYASPSVLTVDGAKLIVAETDKDIIGLTLADGKELWKLPFAPQGMTYNAASPIVDGQTVIYTGSGRGTYAFKVAKDGDKYTTKDVWANDNYASQFATPILKDGFIYSVTPRGNIYCINASTGKLAWADTARHGSGYAALLDAGSVLLALTNDSTLVAFKPSDKKLDEVAAVKVAESPTYAFPIVTGNKIYVKDADSVALLTIE